MKTNHNVDTRTLALLISCILLCGCATTPKIVPTEADAKKAAAWIKNESGFIETATCALTQAGVYAFEKDSVERAHTIAVMNTLASNLNLLVTNKKVDPDSIRDALKVKEPYVGSIIGSISSLFEAKLELFEQNGYSDAILEAVRAISKGISDGTAQ